MGELKKLGIKPPSRITVKKIASSWPRATAAITTGLDLIAVSVSHDLRQHAVFEARQRFGMEVSRPRGRDEPDEVVGHRRRAMVIAAGSREPSDRRRHFGENPNCLPPVSLCH